METKERLIKSGVRPWVKNNIGDDMRVPHTWFDSFEQWISQWLEGIQSPNLVGV